MKPILTLIILCVSILFISFNTYAFTDIDTTHWAYEYVEEMSTQGYLKGYEDNTFKPDNEVTREEFAQMVYNVLSNQSVSSVLHDYYDVQIDRWSYSAVQLIGDSIKETSDGYVYFYPTKPIERQEVAKVLSDVLGLQADVTKMNTPVELAENSIDKKILYELQNIIKFEDVENINSLYYEAVYNVYNAGYMQGMTETSFSPTSSLTRAQAATLLYRILHKDQ